MNSKSKSLKFIALVLSVMVLVQGCLVYETTPTTVQTALKKGKPVKIISANSKTLKFKRIEKEDGQIFGVAHLQSKEARLLSNQIVENPNYRAFVKIRLEESQIDEIYRTNVFLSIAIHLSVFVLVVAPMHYLAYGW